MALFRVCPKYGKTTLKDLIKKGNGYAGNVRNGSLLCIEIGSKQDFLTNAMCTTLKCNGYIEKS
jgi:hypothetical protein